MNTIKFELLPDEVRVLVQALDVATKGGGLQAAQVTLPIAVKLQAAMDNGAAVKDGGGEQAV